MRLKERAVRSAYSLIRPKWQRTGNPYFPLAANDRGTWRVLRVNGFPDHPVYTLFVNGERSLDLNHPPATWGHVHTRKSLSENDAREALAPVLDFVAYGSEVGRPCDGPYCCG